MRPNNTKTFRIFLITAATVVVGGIVAIQFYLLPAIQKSRTTIDNKRTSIAAQEEQRRNVADITKSLATLESNQKLLDTHLWTFANEDAFYQLWDEFSKKQGVTVTDPQLADAVPGKTILTRKGTITVIGSLTNILSSITAVEKIEPLVVIQGVALKPAVQKDPKLPSAVAATIDIVTLWK